MKKFMTAVLEIVIYIMSIVYLLEVIASHYQEWTIDHLRYCFDMYTNPVFDIHVSILVILFLIRFLVEIRQTKTK